MADEPVRSLLAELGFNFDPTGADRFKSSFDDIKISLKDAQGEFAQVDFKKYFEGMEKQFKKGARASEKSLKLQVLNMGARVAKAMARVVKDAFFSFANIEDAQASLELKIGTKGFDKVKKTIEGLPKSIKDLTTELDLYNAVIASVKKTGDLDFILGNLGTAAKMGLGERTDTKSALSAITSFIQSGGGEQALIDFGVFTPDQVEQFKRSKTINQLSETTPGARRGFIEPLIAARIPALDKFISKFSTSSTGQLKKLSSATEETTTFLGENVFSPMLEKVLKFTDAVEDQVKVWRKNGDSDKNKNVTVNSSITINDATDPIKVGQEVKKVLSQTWGSVVEDSELRTPPQSANTIVPPSVP